MQANHPDCIALESLLNFTKDAWLWPDYMYVRRFVFWQPLALAVPTRLRFMATSLFRSKRYANAPSDMLLILSASFMAFECKPTSSTPSKCHTLQGCLFLLDGYRSLSVGRRSRWLQLDHSLDLRKTQEHRHQKDRLRSRKKSFNGQSPTYLSNL